MIAPSNASFYHRLQSRYTVHNIAIGQVYLYDLARMNRFCGLVPYQLI